MFVYFNLHQFPAAASAHFSTALLDSSPPPPSALQCPHVATRAHLMLPHKCPHITAECVSRAVTSQEPVTSTNPAAQSGPKATGNIPGNISPHAPWETKVGNLSALQKCLIMTTDAEQDGILHKARPGEMRSVHAHVNFVIHRASNFTVETPRLSAGFLVDTFPRSCL